MSRIFFTIIVLGLLYLGSIWYVPFRFIRLLGWSHTLTIHIVYTLGFVLTLYAMRGSSASANPVIGVVSTIAGMLIGLHIFVSFSLLVLEGVRLITKLPNHLTAWLALGIALVMIVIGSWGIGNFKVTNLEIPITGLEKDVTIMHISDVHIGHQRGRAYLERIVNETNRLNPDLVLINGDLIDAKSAFKPGVLSALALFKAPVYFTTGNHESYVDLDRSIEVISSQGVHILRNEAVETHGLILVGLDYMNADKNTFELHAVNKMTIQEELPKIKIPEGKPVILMHHSPVGLKYVSARGVNLMLSGHTHGGQFFPATLISELFFPLNKGLHVHGGTQFFVSQGVGTFGPRLRIGTANEINLIRLKAKK